jgi:hypothetical protein
MKTVIALLENTKEDLKQQLQEPKFTEDIPLLKKEISEIEVALILLKRSDICEGCESPSTLKYCEDCYHEACGMK